MEDEESASPDPYGTEEGNCCNELPINSGDASEAIFVLLLLLLLDWKGGVVVVIMYVY
jgi:hypothetical protein